MRIWASLACALALASCFSSNGPVFDETRGECPFDAPTAYVAAPEEASTPIVFETDGAYCRFADASGSSARALFVSMERDWWIVQSEEEHPTYALYHRRGVKLIQYYPLCSDFPASRLRALGVAFDENRSLCTVSDARQVETLFRAWRSPFRSPAGVLQREPGTR